MKSIGLILLGVITCAAATGILSFVAGVAAPVCAAEAEGQETRAGGRTTEDEHVERLLRDGHWWDPAVAVVLLRRGRLSGVHLEIVRERLRLTAAVATQEIVCLGERYDDFRAEARDLEVTLGRIAALDQEADFVAENIRRLGRRMLSLELDMRSGGVGETVGAVSMGAAARPPRAATQPGRYVAQALLAVRSSPRPTLEMPHPPMYSPQVLERHKRSQALLVKQERVLERAIRDPIITRTGWYEANKADPIRALAEAIDVACVPDTSFIRVSMSGTRRDDIADIVNTVAKCFIEHLSEEFKRGRDEEARRLTAQRAALRSRLDRVRRECAAARGSSPIAGMTKDRNIVSIKLEMLTRLITEAETRQARAQAELALLAEATRKGVRERTAPAAKAGPETPTTRPAKNDPSLDHMLRELEKAIP